MEKYQCYRTHGNKELYEKAKRKASKEIKAAKIKYKNTFLKISKQNSEAFWKYVHSETKTTGESVGNLVVDSGEIVSEGIMKATILNDFFTSVFPKENTSTMSKFNSRCEGMK